MSALDRVAPLRYTDDRLAGGLRDLARARGVRPADRDRFLATVTGVLQRRPAEIETVRAQLTEQRDRAAGNLAFELAARIQSEIEAVAWIVAEQKVTSMDPGADAEASGWSGGMLVRFGIRGGRVSGWEQRACGRAAAQPHLDRTPPAWSAFAARAAELAAQLA